jgi:hypothetical protein
MGLVIFGDIPGDLHEGIFPKRTCVRMKLAGWTEARE